MSFLRDKDGFRLKRHSNNKHLMNKDSKHVCCISVRNFHKAVFTNKLIKQDFAMKVYKKKIHARKNLIVIKKNLATDNRQIKLHIKRLFNIQRYHVLDYR